MTSENAEKKKRKRESGKSSSPNKKRAVNGIVPAEKTAAGPDKIKLSHVKPDKNWIPVIASAPGLSISSAISFDAYQDRTSKKLLLHSSDHPRIDYTARENQDGGVQDHVKHYIAIYDLRKKKAKIVEAKSMSVRSTLRAEAQEVRNGQQNKNAQGLSRGQQLALEFGTKKAKKRIAAISRNKISTIQNPEALVADPEAMKEAIRANPAAAAVLESMAEAAANAPSQDALQTAADLGKPRPKHNPDAENVIDLYPTSEVIGDETMRMIKVKPWFDAIEEGKDIEVSCQFVARRLRNIVEESAEDAVKKVRILKWMLVLIKFLNACHTAKGKGRKLPKREELVKKVGEDANLVEAAKKKFVSRGDEMTKWDVDNLMTHLATYSLIVDDFDTDTFDLRQDLDLTIPAMKQYFKEVGARVSKMPDTERAKRGFTLAIAGTHFKAKLLKELKFPAQRKIPVRGRR